MAGKQGEENVLAREFAAGVHGGARWPGRPRSSGNSVWLTLMPMPAMAMPLTSCTRMPAALRLSSMRSLGQRRSHWMPVACAMASTVARPRARVSTGDGRQDDGAVDAVAGFGVPGVAVASLAGGLLDRPGRRCRARQAGGDAHGGIDGIEVDDVAFGEGRGGGGSMIELHHASSRRKLMSMARAEWVMAPEETKSAPVSA